MKEFRYTPDLQLFAGEGALNTSGETGGQIADAGQTGTSDSSNEQEFAQLISGKFKNQFTKKTQEIIDKRFKETKSLEEYKQRVSPVIGALMEKYDVAEGEEHRLADLIANTNEASEETEAESFSADTEEKESEKEMRTRRVRGRIGAWLKESELLKETYPDFDLRKELKSSQLFSQLVLNGVPVKGAYETVHRDEILSGAMAYTADRVREQVVKNIETKGRRPLENGVFSESGFVTTVDVNSLTSEDVLKILKQVENGARIKF